MYTNAARNASLSANHTAQVVWQLIFDLIQHRHSISHFNGKSLPAPTHMRRHCGGSALYSISFHYIPLHSFHCAILSSIFIASVPHCPAFPLHPLWEVASTSDLEPSPVTSPGDPWMERIGLTFYVHYVLHHSR